MKYYSKFPFSYPTSSLWISPAQVLPGTNGNQFQVVLEPGSMNDAGVIYFSNPSNPGYLMSFVASTVKITYVAGPTNVFFDFVGRIVGAKKSY